MKDGTNFFEETYDLWTNKTFEKTPPPSNDFEESVYKVLCPEIRINLTRIKFRALEYLVKIIKIVKVNFGEHIQLRCPEMGPPIDPFMILELLWINTNSIKLRKECEELCFSLTHCPFYGNNIFRSQKILCDSIRPPSIKESKPLYMLDDVESGDEDSMTSRGKEDSDSDSFSDSNTDSNIDLEVDDGQITDKIAIIQEWLFSDPLPNFSRNDTIVEYLTDDTSLEYFFKFIVCPFKSMIHHIVRNSKILRICILTTCLGQEKIHETYLETQSQSQTDC